MALWHLYRMETDPNEGPAALTCMSNENPVKFTLYDSEGQVYSTTSVCIRGDAGPDDILTILTGASYTPNDWD